MTPAKKVEIRVGRGIRPIDIIMIGIGSMLGGSIFALGGAAFTLSGSWFLLAIFLNSILMLVNVALYLDPAAISGRRPPRIFTPLDPSLPPSLRFLSGWITCMAKVVACALYAEVISIFMLEVIYPYDYQLPLIPISIRKLIAVLILVSLVTISYLGLRASRKIRNTLVIAQISLFMSVITAGIVYLTFSGRTQPAVDPAMPHGIPGIILAMALTFISFEGAEVIAELREEAREPRHLLARSVFIAMGSVFAIYLLFYIFMVLCIPGAEISPAGERGTLLAIGAIFGSPGRAIFSAGIVLSGLIALAFTLFSTSRTLFTMGRTGYLPPGFHKIHPRYRTPTMPLIFTGSLAIVFLLFFSFITLAATASLLFLLAFIFPGIASLINRRKRVLSGIRPPSILLPPLLVLMADLSLSLFIFFIDPLCWYLALLLIEVGLLLCYRIYRKEKLISGETFKETPSVSEPRFHVLVAVSGPTSERFLPVADAITSAKGGAMTILNVYEVPLAVPLTDVPAEALQKRTELLEGLKTRVRTEPRIVMTLSHDPSDAIIQEVISSEVNLLVIGWKGTSEKGEHIGTTINPILATTPCDLLVLRPSFKTKYTRILVTSLSPLAARGVAEIAYAIARDNDASVTLLQGKGEKESQMIGLMTEPLESGGIVPSVIMKEGDIRHTLLSEAAEYDLVLIGTEHRTRREIFATPIEEKLLKDLPTNIGVFIKAAEGLDRR